MTAPIISVKDVANIVAAFRDAMLTIIEIIDRDKLATHTDYKGTNEEICQMVFAMAAHSVLFGNKKPGDKPEPELEDLLLKAQLIFEYAHGEADLTGLCMSSINQGSLVVPEPGPQNTVMLYEADQGPEYVLVNVIEDLANKNKYAIGELELDHSPVIRSKQTRKTVAIPWAFLIQVAIATGINDE